jgi:hypothetical protein
MVNGNNNKNKSKSKTSTYKIQISKSKKASSSPKGSPKGSKGSKSKSGIVIKNVKTKSGIVIKNAVSKSKTVGKSKFVFASKKNEKKLLSRINELANENTSAAKNRIEPLEWILPNKKEFPLWVYNTFMKYRQDTKGVTPQPGKPTPLKHQQFLRDYMGKNSPYRGVLLYHGLGSGKCHAEGTPIMMADGSIKKVEDIQVNEELMGDDSKPRKVLSLARGLDKMYEISSSSHSFIVNEAHILCLKRENSEDVIEMSVKDYLALNLEDQCQYYLYRIPIDFNENHLTIQDDDPYTYGSKIGNNESITSIDMKYKCNTFINRLKLLGGIIDHNHFDKDNHDIVINRTYSKTLIDDIVFVARSLGFVSDYYANKFIHINGDLSLICSQKYKLKDEKISLNYSFDVKYVNEDEYFGFTLDGNSRYLMGDFTVTHNTLSSVFIAENLKSERNVVFLSPASLKPNFIQEGLLKIGNPEYNANPKSIYDKYSFVSFNASNTPDQIRAIGGFDNKVIIIEETHNLVSKMVSGIMGSSKHGKEIYDYLMNAKNAKIIALTGSPAINDPFELAVLFNVLRGYIELSYFRINNVGSEYGNRWEFDQIMPQLMDSPYVDYLEFNKVNKSLEVHFTVKHYDERYKDACDALVQKCSALNIDMKYLEKINVPLFPTENEGETFYEYFVDESSEGMKLKNADIFKRRILGLVSYYTAQENIPDKITKDYFKVKMSDYQFKIYEILREKERKTEKGSNAGVGTGKRKKKRTGTKSTFRVFSRQSSNFVFPEEVPRPYPDPSFVVSVSDFGKKKKDNTENLAKMIATENKADEDGEVEDDYKKRIIDALAKLEENGDVYFKPGPNGLDKLSPKMKVMLENINASPGLVFVYSNFRSVEGVEIFSKVLEHNGYSKYGVQNNLPKYAIYSGTEDEARRTELLRVFTNPDNKYGKDIKIIMATSAGAEGLNLKNIRQVHIMEPYWNQVRIRQVIGRGVRYLSHISLPPEERNVEVYRYFSTLTRDQMLMTREKISTDEHIEDISMKKQGVIDELEQCLKEAAVDCMLNAPYIKGSYKCYTFGSDAKGFSYMPSLKKDLITSYSTVSETKKVKKQYLTLYYSIEKKQVYLKDDSNKFYLYRDPTKTPVTLDIKKIKLFAVDPNDDHVYDYKSIQSGIQSLVGVVNKESQIVKKK